MNFTYTVTQPEDQKFGSLEKDGSWNGMIGMLKRDSIDIGLGGFIVSQERSSVASFPFAIALGTQTFIVKTPVDSLNWVAYIEPLHSFAWICVIAVLFIAPIIFYLTLRYF